MSEIALYRKYRPQNFGNLVGQDHIRQTLLNAIKNSGVSHAYLFCGPRGTGKTTSARLVAKAINCSALQENGEPCDKCDFCVEATEGRLIDMIEIDAASNRGIDEIRDLKEKIKFSPTRAKAKVYIIDEVHMLSKDAFNALLKTLEEPPSHVIFILATTDPEKLPDTVISRCQHFKFKKPSEKTLRDMVISVGKGEGFVVENGGAELMAILGDGSFRDTLGILQKVISFASEKKVTEKHVLEVTGAPSSAIVNSIIEGIENAKVEDVLLSIREASESNSDMKSLAKLVIRKVRAVMLLRYAPTMEKSIKEEYSEHDFVLLQKLSQSKSSRLGAR